MQRWLQKSHCISFATIPLLRGSAHYSTSYLKPQTSYLKCVSPAAGLFVLAGRVEVVV